MISAKEFLAERFQTCDCGEIYKSRGLTAPDCIYCNYFDDLVEHMKQYAAMACEEQRKICADNAKIIIDCPSAGKESVFQYAFTEGVWNERTKSYADKNAILRADTPIFE